jgi:hypothetical protein
MIGSKPVLDGTGPTLSSTGRRPASAARTTKKKAAFRPLFSLLTSVSTTIT